MSSGDGFELGAAAELRDGLRPAAGAVPLFEMLPDVPSLFDELAELDRAEAVRVEVRAAAARADLAARPAVGR